MRDSNDHFAENGAFLWLATESEKVRFYILISIYIDSTWDYFRWNLHLHGAARHCQSFSIKQSGFDKSFSVNIAP